MEATKHGTREAFSGGCRCAACRRWFRLTARHILAKPMTVSAEVCGRLYVRRLP